MVKTLFDHIKAITQSQDPNYFDKLEESDLKTWSNYMIHRFLSMNSDWVEILSELQPYTEQLQPKQLYLVLILGFYQKVDIISDMLRVRKQINLKGG